MIHDEIDLPFGEIRAAAGGRVGRTQRSEVGPERRSGPTTSTASGFGVGRPPTTDPDRVAAYVLGKFREPKADVEALIDAAVDATERLIEQGSPPRAADGPSPVSRLDSCHPMLSSLLHHADDDPQTQILAQDGGRAFVSMSLRPFLSRR